MYKKASSPPSYWQSILTKIKNLGLRPEIMAMLNNFNQIVWDTAPPADNPNAIAYVSSEDKNNDGKIDKIHFVLNKFPPNANEDQIDGIVEMVAKTLVHEYGHIEDFNPETNQFPGGEAAAEQAERAFEPLLKQKLNLTTNSSYNLYNKHKISGEIKMLKELVKLANHLDSIGYGEISNDLDAVIKKLAFFPGPIGPTFYAGDDGPTELDKTLGDLYNEYHGLRLDGKGHLYTDGSPSGYTPADMFSPQAAMGSFDPSRSLREQLKEIADSYNNGDGATVNFVNKIKKSLDSRDLGVLEKALDSFVGPPWSGPSDGAAEEMDESVMTQADIEEANKPKPNPTVSRIQDALGVRQTGIWQDVVRGGELRRFLEDNADNLSHEGERLKDSEKVVRILNSGVKGFSVRGGSTARDNSYRSWLKFIEELLSIDTRVTESLETLKNASHGGEDYMSKHHAESIADNAEEISEDLEKGLKLDPWQKTYLAQADLMTDNVEERLDAMAKQLDKLFKY